MNLPETVKGALFARYSRSPKSLRRLFLDEFAGQVEAGAAEGVVTLREAGGNGSTLAIVRHDVWNDPGTAVEAVASLADLERRSRELVFALGLFPTPVLEATFEPVQRIIDTVQSAGGLDLVAWPW